MMKTILKNLQHRMQSGKPWWELVVLVASDETGSNVAAFCCGDSADPAACDLASKLLTTFGDEVEGQLDSVSARFLWSRTESKVIL